MGDVYAAHYRVSSEEQKKGKNILTQQLAVPERAAKIGITIGDEFSDDGVSATKWDFPQRPGSGELWRRLLRGEYAGVIVYNMSRLGRDEADLFSVLRELRRRKIDLISVTQEWDLDTPDGLMMAGITALFSAREVRAIRKRLEDGRATWKKMGYKTDGGPRYGYRSVRNSQERVIYEYDDTLLPGISITPHLAAERIFLQLALEDRSLVDVACWLSDHRVPTPRATRGRPNAGERWAVSTVAHIVHDPIYYGRVVEADGDRRVIVPPIVSEEVWRAAQRQVEANTSLCKTAKHDYMLSGLIRSGSCKRADGRPINYMGRHSTVRRRDGHLAEYLYYGCSNRWSGRKRDQPPCDCPRIPAATTEDHVWRVVAAFMADPRPMLDEWERAYREREGSGRLEGEVDRLRAALADLDVRLRRRVEAYEAGVDSIEQYRERKAEIDQQAAALQADLADAEGRLTSAINIPAARIMVERAVTRIRESLPSVVDVDVKRTLVRALVKDIWVWEYDPAKPVHEWEIVQGLPLERREVHTPSGAVLDGVDADGRGIQVKAFQIGSARVKAQIAVVLALPDPKVLPTEWPYSLFTGDLTPAYSTVLGAVTRTRRGSSTRGTPTS